MRKIVALSLALCLPACATIMEGSGQTVAVDTDPAGALCHVTQNGTTVGDVASTPGSIHVPKSKNDLTFSCSKDGFRTATVSNASSFNGATFGNILAGGIIGAAVDASTGANYNYPPNVHLALTPDTGTNVAAAPKLLTPEPASATVKASPTS